MHLAQHHFQHQGRWVQDSTAFAVAALTSEPWGLVSCELDSEALLNGTVDLLHARGVFPDGLPFHVPEDPAPAPLEIRERFSPTQEAHVVHLVIPAFRPEGPNCALDGGDPAGRRFRATPVAVADETTGEGEVEVEVAGKNLHLALDVEVGDDEVSLPLARVRRDGAGNFVYDDDYVPPAIQVRASSGLLRRLHRLVEILDGKAQALSRDRTPDGGMRSEYAAREISGFWLAHAVHAALPGLRHTLRTRSAHPEHLFRQMSRLAGALCTFTEGAHPRDLPAYDHRDLESTFSRLDRHIRDNLEIVLPGGGVPIPLEPMEPNFVGGEVRDRRCLRPDAEWFLAVRPRGHDPDLETKVPRLVKVCSRKHIVRLVREAYPGLEVEAVGSPPSALAPRVGTRYFRLAHTDPCWTTIVDSGTVGVYVPGALDEASVEIVVLTPE